ncbi:sulfatase-like hydrolase/transferase [Ruthenibacterium lactatiformans]|uniref:sulfatase-like hydrolase/transferase n=1 Tax=Ruthenibacterium lactatiformans TaxID=1550024 RepID=UPI00311AB304
MGHHRLLRAEAGRTPNLDRLAQEGTLFLNAYTCQPVCGPARACLQTGRYATEVGCFRNNIHLPHDVKTLADYLNENDYETAYVGKWHLASSTKQGIDHQRTAIPEEYRGGYRYYWMAADVLEFTSHGYNGYVFDGENRKHEFIGYRADCINNYAIDYLHHRKTEKPFFLFISQIEPHHQNDHNRFEGPDGSKERFREYEVPGDLAGTEGDWRENYPDYLGQCHSLDENVGRLIDTLKAAGEWENTIFIYTSDHGSHFRTRNREYKRSCHDGCTHIPLIIHGPGFNRSEKIDRMVSLLDLPSTILDCAQIPVPADFQRFSLKRLVQGEAGEWPEVIFMQISENQVGRAIRTPEWKYSVRADADGIADSGADVYYEDCLYDLKHDPFERTNLANDPNFAQTRAQLAELLKQQMKIAGEACPQILPWNAEVSQGTGEIDWTRI